VIVSGRSSDPDEGCQTAKILSDAMKHNTGYWSTKWLLLLTGSVFFSCLLVVLSGGASPVSAALILSVDNGDKPVISVTDLRYQEISFSVSEETAAKAETAFSLFGVSYGAAHEPAVIFYWLAPEVAGVPSLIIDQSLSSFGTAQMRPGTVVLQSRAPVKPISSLPSAAFLFGPVLIGILGIVLRQGACLKRPVAETSSSSQVKPVPPTSPSLILILSPDATFAKQTEEQLHRSGHSIRIVPSVAEVFAIANHTPVSMVLVDPRTSDWDMLRTDTTLRRVLMITLVPPAVVYTEEDCQADLERGIDSVHFSSEGPRLLLAKIGAYLRRAGFDVSRRGRYQVGSVELDTDVHEVKIGGLLIPLSAKPFTLLEAFMRAPSKAFTRSELIDLVWGPNFAIGDHTLDVHVHALRLLLNRDPKRLCRLITVKGVGFKLKPIAPVIPATSVPNTLPLAVNSLPLLHPSVARASNTLRSITSSPPNRRRSRLRRVPQQRRGRVLPRETPVRHLRSAVSVG
jgi:DNA-binding response OmpR family regulator